MPDLQRPTRQLAHALVAVKQELIGGEGDSGAAAPVDGATTTTTPDIIKGVVNHVGDLLNSSRVKVRYVGSRPDEWIERQNVSDALVDRYVAARRKKKKRSQFQQRVPAVGRTARHADTSSVLHADGHSPAARLLLAVPDSVAVVIAGHLETPRDLLRLSIAVRRFHTKTIAGKSDPKRMTSRRLMRSTVEEAARLWVMACPSQEQERIDGWPVHDKWLEVMHQVLSDRRLRAPLQFSRCGDNSSLYFEGGGQHSDKASTCTHLGDGCWWTAATSGRMVAGRHFAEFIILQPFAGRYPHSYDESGPDLGVICADHNVECTNSYPLASQDRRNCFYSTHDGSCTFAQGWEGSQSAKQGDRIGLLLDILPRQNARDGASYPPTCVISVYKNGVMLGVLPRTLLLSDCGLSWAVTLYGGDDESIHHSVRIRDAPVPPTTREYDKILLQRAIKINPRSPWIKIVQDCGPADTSDAAFYFHEDNINMTDADLITLRAPTEGVGVVDDGFELAEASGKRFEKCYERASYADGLKRGAKMEEMTSTEEEQGDDY